MKILKRNQIIISVMALMLITVGYMTYTSNMQNTVETGALMDAEEMAGIGDAKLVNSNNTVENTESDNNKKDDKENNNTENNTINSSDEAAMETAESGIDSVSSSKIQKSKKHQVQFIMQITLLVPDWKEKKCIRKC